MKLSNAEIVKRLTGGEFKKRDVDKLNIDFSNKKYNKNDVLKGLNAELEHTDLTKGDLRKTHMIARAHLEENPNYYDLLELLEDPKNYSKLMMMRGEGIRDLLKKGKDYLKSTFSGEIHAPLWVNGKFERAAYMGPGTHLMERLRSGSEPKTQSDKTAQAHDIRYTLAKNQKDIAAADKKMTDKLEAIKRDNGDNTYNIMMGWAPIKLKMFAEKHGIIKPGAIVPIGDSTITPDDDKILRAKLASLESQGFGYYCCGGCADCGGCANCGGCIPMNAINEVGGCHACGGEINLIMQKNTKAITQQIKDSIKVISANPEQGQIFGSYVYRSQYYPGDIDFHEIINTTPAAAKDIYKLMARTLQKITRDVQSRPNIYYSEIKAGIDQRFNIDIDKHFMANVDKIFSARLITLDEYEYLNNLHTLFKTQNNINAHDELKEFFRLKKVIRWSADEILKGHKKIAGNTSINLIDALKGKSDIKIDIWAPINGRYIELTNYFYLVIHDAKTKTIDILNTSIPDYVSGIIEQIQKYDSKLFWNPFKMAKRMWGIARELKIDPLLKSLTPLFQGSAAKINQIIGEIETIIMMYETLQTVPDKVINEQIDEFKLRMSYIYDIEYDDNLFYDMIDTVLKTRDKNKRIKILGDVKTFLKDIRNTNTMTYLRDKELYPVPAFIYHLESQPDDGPLKTPLFRKVYGGKLKRCPKKFNKRCIPKPMLKDIDKQIRAHKSGRKPPKKTVTIEPTPQYMDLDKELSLEDFDLTSPPVEREPLELDDDILTPEEYRAEILERTWAPVENEPLTPFRDTKDIIDKLEAAYQNNELIERAARLEEDYYDALNNNNTDLMLEAIQQIDSLRDEVIRNLPNVDSEIEADIMEQFLDTSEITQNEKYDTYFKMTEPVE